MAIALASAREEETAQVSSAPYSVVPLPLLAHLHAADGEIRYCVIVRAKYLLVAEDFITEGVHVVKDNANLSGSDKFLSVRRGR